MITARKHVAEHGLDWLRTSDVIENYSFIENYIVSICQRDAEDNQKLAGFVEIVDNGKTKVFSSIEELNQILNLGKIRREGNAADKNQARRIHERTAC